MNIYGLADSLPIEYLVKVVDSRPDLIDWNYISDRRDLTEKLIEK